MYSPSWAAPEQLAGQPVSPATDIYSLAVVAVYMLSGKAIFADEDVYAGYKRRRHADEIVKETLAPLGIPSSVISVLARALAFDPKKRLAKVDELSSELQTSLEPSTAQMARVTPPSGMDTSGVRSETNITAEATNPLTSPPQPPGAPPTVPVSDAPTPPAIP